MYQSLFTLLIKFRIFHTLIAFEKERKKTDTDLSLRLNQVINIFLSEQAFFDKLNLRTKIEVLPVKGKILFLLLLIFFIIFLFKTQSSNSSLLLNSLNIKIS